MKKLSKKIISSVLALVMAMPMVFALPSTASATVGTSEVMTKLLEWDFAIAKPTISISSNSNVANYGSVPASYGSATMQLECWSNGSYLWQYDDGYGIKSDDGVAWIPNLGSYLAEGKDIEIRFIMQVRGNESASNKGVFALGSEYEDSGSYSKANDFVCWNNNGSIVYNKTETLASVGNSPTDNYYDYRIYYNASEKSVSIYRDGELKAAKQDNNMSVSGCFGCFTLGTSFTNNWGKNTIKYLSISQARDAATIAKERYNGISKQTVSATTGIVHSGNTSAGAVKSNVLFPNAAGAPDSNQYEDNLSNESNTQMKTKVMFPALRMVFLYDGTANNIKIPVISNSVMRGGAGYVLKRYAVNFISVDGSDWALKSDWYKCSGWNNWNQTVSGSVNDFTIVSYQNTHNHTDYNENNRDGSGGDSENYYSNYVYYNQSISDSTYYKDLTCPTFTIAYDGWAQWTGSWFSKVYGYYNYPSGSSDYPNTYRTGMVPCNGKGTVVIKALNYKPMATAIDYINGSTYQTLFESVRDNEWKYDETSLANFYKALVQVSNYNVNGYYYGKDIGLTDSGDVIKNAVEFFNAHKTEPTKKNFTITYKNKDDESIGTATVAAGNDIANKTSGDAIPSLPSTVDLGNGTHKTYAWSFTSGTCDNYEGGATHPSAPSGTHIPHSNETYKIVETTSACTYGAEQSGPEEDGHNSYKYNLCSVCGHKNITSYDAIDWDAYDDAMDAYNDLNTSLYTDASLSTLAGVVSDNTLNKATCDGSNTTQTAVNNAATNINNAITALTKKVFTITYDMADGSSSSEEVTAGNTLASIPAHTATYSLNNGYHRTNFGWDVTPSGSHVPTAAETYTETYEDVACDHNIAQSHQAAAGDVNGYTDYACSVCSYVDEANRVWDDQSALWATYNAKVVAAAEKYADTAYTTSSRTAYKTDEDGTDAIMSGVVANDPTKSATFINNKIAALEAAEAKLDEVADLTEFDKAYAQADALLKDLAGKTAQYDEDSVQALIDAVTTDKISTGTNITAGTIAAATTERADYGQAVEDDAEELTENIYNAINGLKLVVIDSETHKPVDTSVYDSLVNTINNLDPDAYEDVYDEETDKYVLQSAQSTINSAFGTETLEYAGENINVVTGISSQGDVDAAADVIQSALTVCTKKYTITRTGVTNFGINNGIEEGGKVNYGATLTCNSGDADTAWFLEIQTGSMHKKLAFQSYGRSLKTKVLGTTTVNAIKRDSTNNCRVMITRSYGDDREPVQYATFVPSGTEFELPAAPAIAYTTFSGYSYKDGDFIGTGTPTITVNSDVDIVASYTESDADCAINATDIGDNVVYNSTVNYNDKVELDGGEGAYGWVEAVGDTYRPFYKGQKVSFYATESTTLIAVNETNFNKYGSLPQINLRKSGVIVLDSKYIFNAQIVPGNADVREYGILVAAPSSKNGYTPITPEDSQVIIENSGQHEGYAILRAKSTKLVGANQFTIAVNNLPSGYRYRGYIIYHDGTSLQTVYSEVK